MTEPKYPFLYAPIRACLRGPRNDPRTVAVLLVPVADGRPLVVKAELPDDSDGAAVAEARDFIFEEANFAADLRTTDPEALLRWWLARAGQQADFVYLSKPMAGCAADLGAEAQAILDAYIAT